MTELLNHFIAHLSQRNVHGRGELGMERVGVMYGNQAHRVHQYPIRVGVLHVYARVGRRGASVRSVHQHVVLEAHERNVRLLDAKQQQVDSCDATSETNPAALIRTGRFARLKCSCCKPGL